MFPPRSRSCLEIATSISDGSDPAAYERLAVCIDRRSDRTVRARAESGRIEIEIDDTGVGIPPDEIAHVFDEFFRRNVAKELAPHGWGLGLTLPS